jgi:hypothetical protein
VKQAYCPLLTRRAMEWCYRTGARWRKQRAANGTARELALPGPLAD